MKVLIYMNKNGLSDTGGPTGYCNAIYKRIQETGNNDIFFIDQKIEKKGKLFSALKKFKFLREIKRAFGYIKLMSKNKKHESSIDFDKYDAVHFHLTEDLYSVRDSLQKYKGKVILTSHSPTIASKEYAVNFNWFERLCFGWVYRKLVKMDTYAFSRADHLIFPCEEAEEPYINDLPHFQDLVKNTKIWFLPTGIYPKCCSQTKIDIRERYHIPSSAFVISYVGRHNSIKGYDTLLKYGKEILDKHKDVFFLIAGNQHPLKGLKHERWIEVGWTNNPQSIINASDLFVLPNKSTYFDLVLLEVMSLGIPVLFTYTGGNKYIYQLNDGGLFFYTSSTDFLESFESIYSMDRTKLSDVGLSNKTIYQKHFTAEIFFDSYCNILKQIVEYDSR